MPAMHDACKAALVGKAESARDILERYAGISKVQLQKFFADLVKDFMERAEFPF